MKPHKPWDAYGLSVGVDRIGNVFIWFTDRSVILDVVRPKSGIKELRGRAAWLNRVADWWEAKNK